MLLRRILLTLAIPALLVLLSANCRGKGRDKILTEKQLIDLLVDIHVADGIAMHEGDKYGATYLLDSASLYQSVFDKHGVTRRQFDTTMVFYSSRPKRFNEIYNQVLLQVKRMEDEVTREFDAEEVQKLGSGRQPGDSVEADDAE